LSGRDSARISGLSGVRKKTVQLHLQGHPGLLGHVIHKFLVVVRKEPCDIESGWIHDKVRYRMMSVPAILIFHFLTGTGHHQVGAPHDFIFHPDAVIHMVFAIDVLRTHPVFQHLFLLYLAQRMPSEHEGNAEQGCQMHGHITAVGIMAVDEVRIEVLALDEFQGFVDELLQVRPQ